MTILVIGEGEAVTSSVQALEGVVERVHRCPTVEAALSYLEQGPRSCSLIMIDPSGDDTDVLMRGLTGIDSETPVILIGSPSSVRHGQCVRRALPMCSLERTADGCHRIRCALSEAHAHPAAIQTLAGLPEDQPIAFAYCAPCNGRR